MVKQCAKCSAPLNRQNKSGFCVTHWYEHTRTPEWRERVSKTNLRILFERPELKAQRQELGRLVASLPETTEARKRAGETARKRGYWRDAIAAASTPENRRLAAQSWTERRLGWCPPELRDHYRELLTRRHVPAAEAKEMILAQHEKNMREFRRSIGG